MYRKLLFPLLVGSLLAACSKGPEKQRGPEASLPEVSRALQTWFMAKGSYPRDLNELTNFPVLQGKRLPTPPPGKKLSFDPATRQAVFVEQ